jgi:hypothetical protein
MLRKPFPSGLEVSAEGHLKGVVPSASGVFASPKTLFSLPLTPIFSPHNGLNLP